MMLTLKEVQGLNRRLQFQNPEQVRLEKSHVQNTVHHFKFKYVTCKYKLYICTKSVNFEEENSLQRFKTQIQVNRIIRLGIAV